MEDEVCPGLLSLALGSDVDLGRSILLKVKERIKEAGVL